jgi:hypothetical protein
MRSIAAFPRRLCLAVMPLASPRQEDRVDYLFKRVFGEGVPLPAIAF